jgi:hypothetical protein
VAFPLCRDIHVLRVSKAKSEAELCFAAAIGIGIVLDCARFLSVGGTSIGLCFLADETSFTVCHAREAPDEAVADVGRVTFAAHATHIVDVDISASLDLAVSVTAGRVLALPVLATIHPCRTVRVDCDSTFVRLTPNGYVIVVYAAQEGEARLDVFNIELRLLFIRIIEETLLRSISTCRTRCVFTDGRVMVLPAFGPVDLGSGNTGPGAVAAEWGRAKTLYVVREDGVVVRAQLESLTLEETKR